MKNIIHLKDYSDIYNPPKEKKIFKRAYCTQSRMVGVIGIRIHYEEVVLFFHLDYEEYGFDGFEVCDVKDETQIHFITEEMMGGLGAPLVEITLEEASALIYKAVDIGSQFLYEVPLAFFDYEEFLEETFNDLTKDTYEKITTEMTNAYEKINYFLMRTAGYDFEYRNLMLGVESLNFVMSDEPTMLLKNSIEKSKDCYVCHAVTDYKDAYKMQVIEIKMDGTIEKAEIKSEMVISPKEASFQLNRREYILVGYVDHLESFKRNFERKHPSAMKNLYDGGDLYTIFHSHNDHVKHSVYYLNEDVKGMIYVTDAHQVIIAAYKNTEFDDLKDLIHLEYPTLSMLMELEAEMPLVYQFVTSGQEDFLEFVGE
ncbi:MAG: hypothetical protein JXR88_03125 [Clostridia bacterium]|nr:hypothetical protein [Clostridia bacterium]